MLKTIARWLAIAVVLFLIALALFYREGAGWRWLTKGGWHTTARISSLTPQERSWAQIAWRYVENNTQPQTGLVNGSDKQPRATLWQMGDTLIALLAARELGLVKEAEFDARLTPLLGTLNRLTLTDAVRRAGYTPLRRRPLSTSAANRRPAAGQQKIWPD